MAAERTNESGAHSAAASWTRETRALLVEGPRERIGPWWRGRAWRERGGGECGRLRFGASVYLSHRKILGECWEGCMWAWEERVSQA